MSAINVNSITGRTGTHGPVLTGVTTVTGGTLNTADLNVTGAASFSNNVSIAGTLSYEDVTDIDSVGVITARSGINVTGGQLNVGSNIKIGNAGVITATSFSGDGSNLTGIAADKIFEGNTEVETVDTGSNGHIKFTTEGTEALRIDASGRVLVGTTTEGKSAADNLTIADAANCGVTIRSGATNFGSIYFSDATTGAGEYDGYLQYSQNTQYLAFGVAQVERLRIDSSGRLLIGTDTAPTASVISDALFVLQGYAGTPTGDSLISLQRGQAPASISSGAQIGGINFGANDGSRYAQIHVNSDGAGGTNDYPGRIVFSTTSDGGSSPTERLRIDSKGQLSSGGSTTAFDGTSSLNGLQMYYETDSGLASFGSYSSGGNTHLTFYTNAGGAAATEKLRITSGGNVNNLGNVGVQTSYPTSSTLVGAASSLIGLYIGDGHMLFSDNLSRSGGYYIPSGLNALNAGPVTLNSTMTLDGVWVIV